MSVHLLRKLFLLLAVWTAAILVPRAAQAADDNSAPLSRIALGSCARQNQPQPIWDTIVAAQPELFLFLGDNIYGDSKDMNVLRAKYDELAGKPGFEKLRATCPILATWDDHDYGADDAGADYPMKVESQRLFLDFFEEPADSPRRQREGVYDAKVFGPVGRRVQIVLLDTRYFRGPLKPKPRVPGQGTRYLPNPNTSVTLLGDVQWKWLEAQLRVPAEVRIIASSIQVVSEEHDSEKWMNLPHERERLYRLIRDTGATGVLFVSGDVHRGEISAMDGGVGYPLYDLTASGLTHTAGVKFEDWPNRHRIGTLDWTTSFGMIEFEWKRKDPLIRLQILDDDGDLCLQKKVSLSELQSGKHITVPPPESQGGWRAVETDDEIETIGGMDKAKIAELREWLLKSDNRPFAAVVIRRGTIVLQVERGNSAATDSRRVASVSKAICATVLAIASERSQQGLTPRRMTFEDKAFDFIPWARPLSDPRKADITVKQLLNHTSGICPEAVGAANDGTWDYILGHSGDRRTAKLAFDPGTGCGYSTHALVHASLVCETVTGKPYDEFAIEALLKPLGIEKWWFQYYEGGQVGRKPSHGLGLPARELARIGYCMLHDGRWSDKQVIPRWFVEQTAQPSHNVTTPEMRWKLNPAVFTLGWELPAKHFLDSGKHIAGIPADARYKPGSGGQLIAFVPSLDLVIARQTGGSGQWDYEEFLRRACNAVLSTR